MVTIPCPWCDEEASLSLTDVVDPEMPFTCPACGTSVAVVDEPLALLDLAA